VAGGLLVIAGVYVGVLRREREKAPEASALAR